MIAFIQRLIVSPLILLIFILIIIDWIVAGKLQKHHKEFINTIFEP